VSALASGLGVPGLRARRGSGAGRWPDHVLRLRFPYLGDGVDDLRQHADAAHRVVRRLLAARHGKDGVSALSLQRGLEIGSYQTAWAMLHRLRSALVRAGRDGLTGTIEVDETYQCSCRKFVR
jgi:hypothetical protein